MPNDINKITLCCTQIELSQDKTDPDIYRAKFLISGFGVNKNNVQLDREHIEDWLNTLVDKPVVGKVSVSSTGVKDFESHNLKVVTKLKNGKPYKEAEFDTTPFGHFTSASIETADDGKEYIYADAVLYKRYKNAIEVLERRMNDNEQISTSWEIAVEESKSKVTDGKIVKLVTKGRFLAHCFLGAKIEPAFDESGLLAVASKEEQELDTALSQDYIDNFEESSDINTEDKEVNMRLDNKEIVETSEVAENSTEQENTTVTEETSEVVDPVDKSAKDKDKESDNKEKDDKDTDDTEKTDDEDEEKEKSESKDNDGNKENDDEDEKEKSDITETSALTDSDLRHHLEKAFEQKNEDGHCTYGWIFMIFPADNTAWFRECGKCSDTELVEVKYTVENNNVTITERNNVVLTVSPREINQTIAQKDSAIAEMSSQIKSLTDEVSALKPYKDKVEEIEKAEKEAQLEQDRKELSEYAISSGYITAEEVETSEEIKSMINDLNKVGIQSIISDRVVSQLNNKKTTNVEISEDNSEKQNNISVNLSAIDVSVSAKNGKNISTKDATDAVRRYIGRR